MGEVWRAEREGPGGYRRRAAVKRILPRFQADPTLRARFLSETGLDEEGWENLVSEYEPGGDIALMRVEG